MASNTDKDASQLLLRFGNFIYDRELRQAELPTEILDPSEVDWISYHTVQDDHLLFKTAMNLLNNYDDSFFTETEEELEVMIEVWREIKAFKTLACGPPRNRQLLESFVICFYVISHRANFTIDHLSESMNQLRRSLLSRPRSGDQTNRADRRSGSDVSEQAFTTAVVPNEEESDVSSLQDYESDINSAWTCQVSV